jgi:hypothetical protein
MGDVDGNALLARAGVSQGVGSSWAAIVSSILASPPMKVSINVHIHEYGSMRLTWSF